MSQVQTAALTLVAITIAYFAIVWVVWRMRQPRTPKMPREPRAARAPRMAGESRLPRLPRREREVEAPVEISASRLARISARPDPAPVAEAEAPAIEADTLVAERPAPPPEPSEGDRAAVAQMLETLATQVAHEADLLERRGGEAVAVRLVPQIPPRRDEIATSWIGGRPRLDPGVRWPEIRDVPGDFVAQIACSDLPRDLWEGLGPRLGSLALFIHPRDGDAVVVPVVEDGPPMDPPHPIDGNDSFFSPAGAERFGDLMPFMRHAFPEWPVDLVAVRPGEADPRRDDGAADGFAHDLHRRGYDLADPAFHPFDWDSMAAMAELLAMRIAFYWQEVEGASPIDTQIASVERRLVKHDAGERDPLGRGGLVAMRDTLTHLSETAAAARETNREARERAEEIIAIVRDSAHRDPFTPDAAAAVMQALQMIRWTKVLRQPDPEGRPGVERVEARTLPLTQHDPEASLWAHDYLCIWFDHAKHAYAADPVRLSDAARAVFEPWARDLAAHEMPSIGHVPSEYVHDFDAERDATLIELPSSELMSWTFGDVHNLVVTMRKADLAAGRWDRPLAQLGN